MDIEQLHSKPETLPLRTLNEASQQALANILPLLDRSPLLLATGDQLLLKARVLRSHDLVEGGYWLTGPKTQPALRLVLWNGAPVITHPERIASIAALLVEADILLSALELKIGAEIEPDHISERVPQDNQLIEVDFYRGATLLHRIWIGFPAGFRLPSDSAMESINTTQAVVVVSLHSVAASLDVDDASAIGVGDLLILRGGNWQTILETPFGTVQGLLNPNINQLSIAHGETMQGQSMTSDDNAGEGGGFGALRVPVSVRLPDQSLTIEELGKLRAGLAVPVGQISAGMMVELLVAGRVIAKGELVRLGEQFAVHIDSLPQDDLPQNHADGDAIELPDETNDTEGTAE